MVVRGQVSVTTPDGRDRGSATVVAGEETTISVALEGWDTLTLVGQAGRDTQTHTADAPRVGAVRGGGGGGGGGGGSSPGFPLFGYEFRLVDSAGPELPIRLRVELGSVAVAHHGRLRGRGVLVVVALGRTLTSLGGPRAPRLSVSGVDGDTLTVLFSPDEHGTPLLPGDNGLEPTDAAGLVAYIDEQLPDWAGSVVRPGPTAR